MSLGYDVKQTVPTVHKKTPLIVNLLFTNKLLKKFNKPLTYTFLKKGGTKDGVQKEFLWENGDR